MQFKAILIPLFIATSLAAPSTPDTNIEPVDSVNIVQGTDINPETAGNGISPQKQKNWQAAGGCKSDWNKDRRCISQCAGEAVGKCPGWKSITAVIQGGCRAGQNTCRCVCEY